MPQVLVLVLSSVGTTRRRKILSAYRLGSAAFILVPCIIQVVLDLMGTRPPLEVESEVPQE